MTETTDKSSTVTITAGSGLQQLLQNPTVFLVMLLMLGGQGADLFASTTNTAEFRQLRADVEEALHEITDNRERIARNDQRIDEVSIEVRGLRRDLESAQRDRDRLTERIAACEAAISE